MMKREEVEEACNMLTDNFSIRTHPLKVLFASSATHSFISTRLVETLRLILTSRHSLLLISLPDGKGGKLSGFMHRFFYSNPWS